MRKRTAAAAGLIAGSLLLAGCPSPPPESEPGNVVDQDWGEPVPGGQLVTRYIGDAKYFNPVIGESVADSYVNTHMFPYLTDSGFENCEVTTPPMLASSWEWSDGIEGEPGGRTLTYHLRDDVVWQDGEPIDAEDVLFSYDLFKSPAVASPRYSYTEKMTAIEAPDPHTVVFRFSEIYPPQTQLFHTGLGLVPEHVLGDVDPGDLRASDFNRDPVVAGPFELVRYDPGAEIVLDRCETCNMKSQPYLDRVVVRIIPEETTSLVALKRGSIDYMELSTFDPLVDIKKNHPEIRVINRGYRFMDYVAWNSKDPDAIKKARAKLGEDELLDLDAVPSHPLFGETEVRRALTMAIDIPSIMEAVTSAAGETYGRPATGTITPELCKDYADIDALPYDPDRAREILAEHGWKDRDGDTVLDKDGRPFHFTINYNSGNQRRYDACVYIQSMLKEVGIEVEVEPIESSVFFTNLRQKDFHAALAGWSAALVIDPTDMWHSGAEYAFNFTSYSDPEVDRLIDQGVVTLDQEERRAIWKKIQRRVYEDQPYTFLYWYNGIALIHERFQDVQSNVLTAYYNLEEWWVPEELRKYNPRQASR